MSVSRLLVLACLVSAPAALAQSPSAHRHLGVFVRLDLGIGGFGSQLSEVDLHLRGDLASFGVGVGGALSQNLILAAHLFAVGNKFETSEVSATWSLLSMAAAFSATYSCALAGSAPKQ